MSLLIQAKDEEDSSMAAVPKKMKTPEVARESSSGAGASRSSLLLRAAVGAVEADEAGAAEKVFEGGFFSVRSPMAAASGRSPLQRITPTNTPGGGLAGSTSNSREDDGLISLEWNKA